MSPDILTSLSTYLMVLLAVLLVDKSMYDIGLIHPKSSAAQKNPLLIAQCSVVVHCCVAATIESVKELKLTTYSKISKSNCGPYPKV